MMMTDEQTIEPTGNEAVDDESETNGDEAAPAIDLSRIRDLVLAAHPDVVPAMIAGETFEELMSSVEPAREAYQRIASEASKTHSTPRVAAQPGQRAGCTSRTSRRSPRSGRSARACGGVADGPHSGLPRQARETPGTRVSFT
jgi:hypothetical protein